MKTAIRAVLTHKVHYLLFAMTCLLLAAVAVSAKIMADDISAIADRALADADMPLLTKVRI